MAASEQGWPMAAAGSVWEGSPPTGRPAVSPGSAEVAARARAHVAGGAHPAGAVPLALLVWGPACACLVGWELEMRRLCDETAAVTSVVSWPQVLLAKVVAEACSMGRGAWWAPVYGVAKSWTRLSK